MSFNKFPWSNLHGFNLDWVIQTVQECKSTVDGIVEEVNGIFEKYVTKENLTNTRKLSESGDFTGTLCNSLKTACEVVAEIDTNSDQIEFLTDQFSDGATGLVIECGFFTDGDIDKNYDGGVW